MSDISLINEMLQAIPVSSLNYQDWVNVGMALHNEGLPCSLWDEWSRNDSRYHAGECEKKWRSFGHSDNIVTVGTIYHLAISNGWVPASSIRTFDWDDYITSDGDPIDSSGWHKDETKQLPPPPLSSYNAAKDVSDYLAALFEPDDKVCYVVDAYKSDDNKWKPYGGVCCRKCSDLLASIKKHSEDLTDTFGTYNQEAGVWVCFNPIDGDGRTNKNVTSFRYALVESDVQDIDTQYALLQDLRLPIKMLVHSGGRSLHAIVSIGAVDYKQYQERVDYLYTVCRKHGLSVDTQDKNPSRLSRLPGFMREGKKQYIVDHDMGLSDWVEWYHYIEDELVEPLRKVNLGSIWDSMPPLKPELIEGILRQGHKMMLASSSKAGKTFLLIELAIAVAEGRRWIGFRCKQGRVLYLNMELDEASFDNRFKRVYDAMEIEDRHPENIDIVHLRGQMEHLEKLVPQIVRTAKGGNFSVIILDPIYKLGIGDENAADQVTKFCNAMDKLANTGASVVYAHHHSKGIQGTKSSMDRASGSGVFARDPDALLDMIELRIPESREDEIKAEFGQNVTGWRLDATLREFAPIVPVDLFFAYPVHEIDEDGWLKEANLEETERTLEAGRKMRHIEQAERKKTVKEALLEAIGRDEDYAGKRKSYEAYAAELGVSKRTVMRYMKEIKDEIE